MSAATFAVWALPRVGEPVQVPDLADWSISPSDTGDWGSLSFSYAVDGLRAELLAELADDDVDLEVEVSLTAPDGEQWLYRGLLLDADTDDVADTGMIKVSGALIEWLLGEVRVGTALADASGDTALIGTAGKVMRLLLTAAQARGCLAGVTWTFTDTLDSNGVPWIRNASMKFSPQQHYAAVLGTLRGYQLSSWELTHTRVLRLVNPEGKGVDRSTGPLPALGTEWAPGNALVLEHGRDLADAPRKWSLRNAINALVTAGKDGLYDEATDPTAQARRGRRIEGFKSYGNAADAGTLAALTQGDLTTMTRGEVGVSHKITLRDGGPIPLIHYGVSDYLLSATGRGGVKRRRVTQVTVTGSGAEALEAAVDLDTVFNKASVDQEQRLRALENGETVVGTSTAPPEVDDGVPPVAPADVIATSQWYAEGEVSAGFVAVAASWSAVADPSLAGYVVEYRYPDLDGQLGGGWIPLPLVTETSTTWSGVTAGVSVAVRVRARDKFGRTSGPSPEYLFTTETDVTPPPIASAAAPYSHLGLLVVSWDGRGAVAEPMPGDFEAAELHLSTTSGAVPDRPMPGGVLNLGASTTYAGELRAAGELPVDIGAAGYGVTYYARWVLRDRSGNAAAAGAQGSTVLARVADGDIAQLSIGKLTVGIMSAIMTISGIIRTASAGARVELDAAGLRCYSSTGVLLFNFSIPTSLLTITGRLIAGAGIGVGPTISVDPNDAGGLPRINMYPDATSRRYRVFCFPVSGQGPSWGVEYVDSGGAVTGPEIQLWETGATFGLPGSGSLFVANPTLSYIRCGRGRAQVTDDTSLIGLRDGGLTWGYSYNGPAGFGAIQTAGHIQVVSPDGGSYREMRASVFAVNCSAEFKDNIRELPEDPLDALRDAVIARYSRHGQLDGEVDSVGPLAETLPEWMIRPREERLVGPPREGEVMPPNSEQVDVMTWTSTVAAALLQLDREVDELRRAAGRPIPRRRDARVALDDARAGRLRRRTA